MWDDLMVDTVTITRLRVQSNPTYPGLLARSAPQDPGGGFKQEYDPGETNVMCAIQPSAGQRNENQDKVGTAIDVVVYFNYDPNIKTKDKLIWLTADGKDKSNAFGAYPEITLDGRVVAMAGFDEVFKVTGVIRPV